MEACSWKRRKLRSLKRGAPLKMSSQSKSFSTVHPLEDVTEELYGSVTEDLKQIFSMSMQLKDTIKAVRDKLMKSCSSSENTTNDRPWILNKPSEHTVKQCDQDNSPVIVISDDDEGDVKEDTEAKVGLRDCVIPLPHVDTKKEVFDDYHGASSHEDTKSEYHVGAKDEIISKETCTPDGLSLTEGLMQEVPMLGCILQSKCENMLSDKFEADESERKDEILCEKISVTPEAPLEMDVDMNLYSNSDPSDDNGLQQLWNEMSLAAEFSKGAATLEGHNKVVIEDDEDDCEHSYVLKDDLGLVCRVCGLIQKSIEEIFDYQWTKPLRSTRTYVSESQNSKDANRGFVITGPKLPDNDMVGAAIFIHPRHERVMKPHQLEGFNFLMGNLITNNPGGCILAHAPGSGKTFMLISFIQSFFGKYPSARPMIIVPKGILSTWKMEFRKWQVEEIPLYDFYSSKADKRAQQLEILKSWEENKSILILSYKQLTNIVCGGRTSEVAAACEERLLKVPSLLIIDEGHTPRNDDTDVLCSLARIHTPRKVVLSGTLFQNHVKEVFNILELVRPKFMKMEASRTIARRIFSRVHISGGKRKCSAYANGALFEFIEESLTKDTDFKRKVAVIQDLREMTHNVLHYYKGNFLDELPGIYDITVLLNLSRKQKLLVQKLAKLEKFKRTSLSSVTYIHPLLLEISKDSILSKGNNLQIEKIEHGIERLEIKDGVKANFVLNILSLSESVGEKVLVFSQYLLPLKFLERLVCKMKGWVPGKQTFMISGDSSSESREWSMDRFNNSSDAKVLFGSIKACGEGISLVGASRVVILDIHLNPSVSRQAIGRAYRPGQTKKVYVYRLVAADSFEEDDHKVSLRKEQTSKMWFEWSQYCDAQDFTLEQVDARDCEDMFLESPHVTGDIKALYRR